MVGGTKLLYEIKAPEGELAARRPGRAGDGGAEEARGPRRRPQPDLASAGRQPPGNPDAPERPVGRSPGGPRAVQCRPERPWTPPTSAAREVLRDGENARHAGCTRAALCRAGDGLGPARPSSSAHWPPPTTSEAGREEQATAAAGPGRDDLREPQGPDRRHQPQRQRPAGRPGEQADPIAISSSRRSRTG